MSNVLWLPLVLGMVMSAYITYRTIANVRLRAIVAFVVVAAVFALMYVPELASDWSWIGVRTTDFVGYVLGESWLSQLWLIAVVVDLIRRFTRTQIREAGWIGTVLDVIAGLGLLWLFWSFITGHPINAFG